MINAIKRFFIRTMEEQERLGRVRAAQHLMALGYIKEAKALMTEQ